MGWQSAVMMFEVESCQVPEQGLDYACAKMRCFHTKNNLSFVLLENTQYFTEHVKNPKVAQN